MDYLHWDEKIVTDFSAENISAMYNAGYVFTRIGKGVMHQTRSVRVNLAKFELSSENRRVLRKVGYIDGDQSAQNEVGGEVKNVTLQLTVVPRKLPIEEYDWQLGKTAKDFYEMKFGPGIMSAVKLKEMLTDVEKSNFNCLLEYTDPKKLTLGYAICHLNKEILHYSYPFYHIDISPKDMGLGMMIMAIEYAKREGLKYVYLGSLQRPTDTYKLQFAGLEWFDGGPDGSGTWQTDMEKVKKILAFA